MVAANLQLTRVLQHTPVDPIAQGLELLPIPAAHISRAEEALALVATNRAFRLGLGMAQGTAPLATMMARIEGFLASKGMRQEFAWALGEGIDAQLFRVTLARLSGTARDSCQASFIDQTAQMRTERSLRREMTTDSLTGLPNRAGFGDLIDASDGARAVMVLDLVRFGRVNACLGGVTADELLITVARRIKGALRGGDTLARIGGDQFGILIRLGNEPGEAEQFAQRLLATLATPFRLSDYVIGVECSIGIACGSGTEDGNEELIRHAQFATKRAKATRRIETYQSEAFALERVQFGHETALRRAIEGRDLRLAFQPIHELGSGKLVTFEALARWTDAGRIIAPNEFIPLAEETGLIVPLGRWAIEAAMQTLAEWDRRAGGCCGVQIAVNLSAVQLQRDSIGDVVREALARHSLAGDRLKLELTESALVVDPEGTAATLHALKALGAGLAMDDFGTGYSNLAALHSLPIDVLKIDRSLVADMLDDPDKLAIIRAILALANALALQTVAEGVETQAIADTLRDMGCTMAQGYFFGRPLDLEAAWSMIASA